MNQNWFGSNNATLIVAGDAESNSDVITPSVVVKPIFCINTTIV
jgi:hypothetical protein